MWSLCFVLQNSTWWLWDLFLCGPHSTISTNPSCVWQPKLAQSMCKPGNWKSKGNVFPVSTGSCFLAKSIGLKVSTISSFKEVSIKESCPQRSKDLQKMSVFSTWLIKIRRMWLHSVWILLFLSQGETMPCTGVRKEWDHWIEHRRGKPKDSLPKGSVRAC